MNLFPIEKRFVRYLTEKKILKFSIMRFFLKSHVTPEDMEMSEITLRIEWKHYQKPAGPASGRNRPLKGRNIGFCPEGTFFQSFGKFGNWKIFRYHARANFF